MYIIVALLLAVGVTGALVQIWPSTPFLLVGFLIWAIYLGGVTAWVFFALSTVLLIATMVLKFLIPGKQLKNAGIPNSTLLLGGVGAVAGFFLIPVVGLPLGFLLSVAVAEGVRLNDYAKAKDSVITTLKATGVSVLIEFSISFALVLAWAIVSLFLAFG